LPRAFQVTAGTATGVRLATRLDAVAGSDAGALVNNAAPMRNLVAKTPKHAFAALHLCTARVVLWDPSPLSKRSACRTAKCALGATRGDRRCSTQLNRATPGQN
jgi:hypothetical protein